MPRKKEFEPKLGDKKQGHEITPNPIIWARLQSVANRMYGGSVTKAIEGLALHEWMVEVHRMAKGGRPNDHWISAPLVNNPGELAPILERLQRGESDEIASYFDVAVSKRAARASDQA